MTREPEPWFESRDHARGESLLDCARRWSCTLLDLSHRGPAIRRLLPDECEQLSQLLAVLAEDRPALEHVLDEAVDRWHESCPNEERSLHEWLGVSWDAYADYAQRGVGGLIERLTLERAESENSHPVTRP